MIGFAVIVGEFVSKPGTISIPQSILGFLTGFFVCAYSMVINDIYDVEVDRVNQPGRPIPSGRISIAGAKRISLAVLIVGIACSVLSLNPFAVAVACVYAALSWFYSSRAKRAGIAGNLIVASSIAIPFIYGGVISGGSILGSLLLLMSLTAFFSGVGREVVKAIDDVDGDAKRGVKSIARSSGKGVASVVGGAFFLVAVFTSLLPLLFDLANRIYQFGVVIPDVVFIYLAASILLNPNQGNAHRVKNWALLGMLLGLIVFIGGGL
jgi:geranylgeranylglycerol-phosphate geranylgeranyltransferase